jgi:methionyl aminopeptidase
MECVMIILKTNKEIETMRAAGRVVALAHQELKSHLRAGITTQSINDLLDAFIRDHGGIPSFLGYQDYPASVCVSINEEVVHGIPSQRVLRDGDIVSVDIGVYLNGFHGDSAWSYAIGEPMPEVQRLFEVTEAALYAGIEQAKEGRRLHSIGYAIQNVVEGAGFHIPRGIVGHGIGRDMHEDPDVPNYFTKGKWGPRLRAGMVLAIEPMVQVGTWETALLADEWTMISADRSLAAHFEHTVAITEAGPQILTTL